MDTISLTKLHALYFPDHERRAMAVSNYSLGHSNQGLLYSSSLDTKFLLIAQSLAQILPLCGLPILLWSLWISLILLHYFLMHLLYEYFFINI